MIHIKAPSLLQFARPAQNTEHILNSFNHSDAMLDTLDHGVIKCPMEESVIRKIINFQPSPSKSSLIIGQFNVKYPHNSPLITLALFLHFCTDKKSFALQFHCTTFPHHIASTLTTLTFRYVIYCKALHLDSWSGDSFSLHQQSGHLLFHDSFEIYKFRKWLHSKSREKSLEFVLNIGDIIIDPKSPKSPNFSHSANRTLIASLPFDFNDRHLKWRWVIPRDTIRKFKDYKDGQWIRSPLFGQRWYVVLYPAGSTDPTIGWKEGFVQFSLDMMTMPRALRGIHGFWNMKILETSTHCTELRGFIFTGLARCPNAQNTLSCQRLLDLDTITVEAELVLFRYVIFGSSKIIDFTAF